jgi:hypothetical protein
VTTSPVVFSVPDANFNSLMLPSEVISPPIALSNGGFSYVEQIFDHNPTTGLPWTRDEIEQIETGLQFIP